MVLITSIKHGTIIVRIIYSSFHDQVDSNEKRGRIMLFFMEDLQVKVLSVDKFDESCYSEVIL